MGRGKRRDRNQRPGEPEELDFIVSYGRHQALGDEVLKEREVTSAPDFVPLLETGQVVITPGTEDLPARPLSSDGEIVGGPRQTLRPHPPAKNAV